MQHPRCKYCNKEILWIEWLNPVTGELKKIPVDVRASTYDFIEGKWMRSGAKVNHLAICTNQPKPEPEIKAQDHVEDHNQPWYKRDDL
ncbi:hypothetical protein UFOVP558_42 [uncultured Caudovirales phage]|uniref:Uncharacterized protein n=1 Tax=uncultured Caudovirales phage TaxID=2100421 RepID=A0A6J5MTY5_9CAUD|nr:hypothetical protein UFOVP558_42 [uncultured Caudovirales phage]